MGSPSSEITEPRYPATEPPVPERPYPRISEPERRPRKTRRHIILFALTLISTMFVGADQYVAFQQDFTSSGPITWSWTLLFGGMWYSLAILSILGAHEFGHYFACRYYNVDASLPYFLPAPFVLTGTFGAFIRIRQPIPTKRELFDIGIAGPIAGFLVAVPVLLIGISLSRVVRLPPGFNGVELGEPLLFQAVSRLVWGVPPDGYSLNMHPMGFAAWFGLLATALNLFPIGQLDGGHISYAVLGRKSTAVTLGTVVCLMGLSFISSSWIVWTVLTVGMLIAFGPRHPKAHDEDIPLDPARRWLAVFALLMFVLCFTPAPIEPYQLVGGR